ncbi:MAG: CCA tRNA nucleotidyltransferase [Chloroflexota bacterium]
MKTDASLFVEAEAASLIDQVSVFMGSHGIECYLVGGYIRDGILGRTSRDVDLAVGGNALEIARDAADDLNGRFVLLDEEHQVARVVIQGSGGQWHLDFASMLHSIEEDLARRDFTINALAIELTPLQQGENQVSLIDTLDGVRDLKSRSVKAVSEEAFRDDPARLLRAFSIAAELDFTIEEETEVLIRRDRELIKNVSSERVRDELCQILETGNSAAFIRRLDYAGLLDIIFPELANCKGVEQPKEHFWNVFDHSVETVAAVERLFAALTGEGDLLKELSSAAYIAEQLEEEVAGNRTRKVSLKMAALLHDVAKPQAKQIGENGRMRFIGHDKEGAGIAESTMERLRFSTREKRMVTTIIEHHMRPGNLANGEELPTRRAIYRFFRDTDDVGIDTLFLGLADHLATRGPALDIENWHEHVRGTQYILDKWFEEESTVSPPKLVDGHDIMGEFELPPGPKIGELLEEVREAQASGEIQSKEEALNFVRKELDKENASKR